MALSAAVEFSFLLGFVTLGAATPFESVNEGPEIAGTFGLAAPLAGLVVAFISAVAFVRWMVSYLRHGNLTVFGAYRLAAAVAAVTLLASGVV